MSLVNEDQVPGEIPLLDDAGAGQRQRILPPMSLRQHAAIQLKVPDSGDEWLDEMIRQAKQDEFAGQATEHEIKHIAPYVGSPNTLDAENIAAQFARARDVFASAMLAQREACPEQGRRGQG